MTGLLNEPPILVIGHGIPVNIVGVQVHGPGRYLGGKYGSPPLIEHVDLGKLFLGYPHGE
jgi:hypothetical protein